MIQTGSQMLPLLTIGLVSLICSFTTLCAGAAMGATASKSDSHRETCVEIKYDIREAVCCENQLHPGAGLSCCGGQAFNPEEATCCKVEDGKTITDLCEEQIEEKRPCVLCCTFGLSVNRPVFKSVTKGLSEKVSNCCGLTAYNQLNEICCQSAVRVKPAPVAQCCGKEAFDVDKQMCCGPISNKTILTRSSSDHQCCGHNQFDAKTDCCCLMKGGLKIQPISSSCCVEESALCGKKTYSIFTELCCQSTVVAKTASNAQCCGKQAFNKDTQLCCGPTDNKRILCRESRDHQCCGHNQFDAKTDCCCLMKGDLKIQPISSTCCVEESGTETKERKYGQCLNMQGVEQQKLAPQPNCTEPETSPCGSSCYNPSYFCCCAPGRPADAPVVYNPHTHVCCDGCVSEWKPRIDQFHGLPGQRCCRAKVHLPHTEICCDGQRHLRKEKTHCCGVKAYNIKDPQMKCCAGTLHTMTIGHEAQCCGSILQTAPNVCCSSEDMEVLYSAKMGFGCCGHLYYNSSLWSCCAGKLSPAPQPGQHRRQKIKESILLSLNNLNEEDLCDEMHIGTVESVSPHGIVFNSVLEIHGRSAIVIPLASPHILQRPDHCSIPKLVPGKSYFFDKVNVFTDFNHDSILQSFHFIISKCYRPVTTTI